MEAPRHHDITADTKTTATMSRRAASDRFSLDELSEFVREARAASFDGSTLVSFYHHNDYRGWGGIITHGGKEVRSPASATVTDGGS